MQKLADAALPELRIDLVVEHAIHQSRLGKHCQDNTENRKVHAEAGQPFLTEHEFIHTSPPCRWCKCFQCLSARHKVVPVSSPLKTKSPSKMHFQTGGLSHENILLS